MPDGTEESSISPTLEFVDKHISYTATVLLGQQMAVRNLGLKKKLPLYFCLQDARCRLGRINHHVSNLRIMNIHISYSLFVSFPGYQMPDGTDETTFIYFIYFHLILGQQMAAIKLRFLIFLPFNFLRMPDAGWDR